MELRAGLLREFARLRRVEVGHREVVHRGVLRGEPGPQGPDAPRADDRYAQWFAFDGSLPAVSGQSTRTPASLMSFAYFLISERMNAPSSSGGLPIGSIVLFTSRLR